MKTFAGCLVLAAALSSRRLQPTRTNASPTRHSAASPEQLCSVLSASSQAA